MFWDGVIASDAQYWVCWIMTAVFGVCIGSFLNVCIWRMPRRESVVFVSSHCPNCNHAIRAWENIPIVSFLLLHGRCSGCKKPISPRYWLVELLTGILFIAIFMSAAAAGWNMWRIIALFGAMPLAVAGGFIDVEHRIVPDALTVPTMIFGLLWAWMAPENWQVAGRWEALGISLLSLAGTYIGLRILAWAGEKLFRAEAFGQGDVKFMAACAALLGPWSVPVILLAGSLGGSVFGIACALIGKQKLREVTIAFAPWLAVGTLIWCLVAPWAERWLP